MNDKVFIDSNIWLYALIQGNVDDEKRERAKACIIDAKDIIVSTQIVNEVCINLIRKGKKDTLFIDQFLSNFVATYTVMSQTVDDVLKVSCIRKDYSFSYWDSLVIACAIRGNCNVLFSEDSIFQLTNESERLFPSNPKN